MNDSKLTAPATSPASDGWADELAFPSIKPPTAGYKHFAGMTLRDYFAAAAMRVPNIFTTDEHPSAEHAARYAYAVADAMLRARRNPPNAPDQGRRASDSKTL